MGHMFRIYEVDKDGTRHITEKIAIVNTVPFIQNGYLNGGTLVEDLFKVFGWDKHLIMYHVYVALPNGFEVRYSYHCDDGGAGHKPTWYLKRGA